MSTLATFRGRDLEPSFAQQIGATPDARVDIKVTLPEEEAAESNDADIEAILTKEERAEQLLALQAKIKIGMDQVDRGETVPADQVFDELRQIIADKKAGK